MISVPLQAASHIFVKHCYIINNKKNPDDHTSIFKIILCYFNASSVVMMNIPKLEPIRGCKILELRKVMIMIITMAK